jgi:hypothetical protein
VNCPTDNILRARLDGELSVSETESVDQHLASCDACSVRRQALETQSAHVSKLFAPLTPPAGPLDPHLAFAHLQNRLNLQPKATLSLLQRLFVPRFRVGWIAAAAVLVISAFLSLSPTRIWAQKVLAMLRVQKIAVVSFDATSLDLPSQASGNSQLLHQLVSDTVVVTMRPGNPQVVNNAMQASQLTGMQIRTLHSSVPLQRLIVNGEAAFHMNLNRERIQTVLEEVGRSDIQLPASVDGATVAVHIPKVVVSEYGDCPVREHDSRDESGNLAPDKLAKRKREWIEAQQQSNCTYLVQASSPTVSVPPDLNMGEIAEAGFQLAGMTQAEAHALGQKIDWSSTLVIPVPRNVASSETVNIDGVEGTLVTENRRGLSHYNLIWAKNGVIYSLGGQGNLNDALSLAASLK